MKIIDNFLDEVDFQDFLGEIESSEFPWMKTGIISEEYSELPEARNIQFCHMFYQHYIPASERDWDIVRPIVEKLSPYGILRIKANLLVCADEIYQHGFHCDINDGLESDFIKTGILYLNTNNGHTLFEDGTKVESVRNRLVEFPNTTKHTGTTCTDSPCRMVLNLSYIN